MDFIKKTKTNSGKGKFESADEPPPYSTIAPSFPQQASQPLPKQTSTDRKPKQLPTEYTPVQDSSNMDKKMPRMPRDDDFVEEKRPRKGKQPVDPGSEDSDSGDMKKSKQLVRRDKKEVAKRGKSRRPRDDSDDDEEEMIVTKTVRKKTLDIDDIDDGFVALLSEAFRVRTDKVASWCEKDLIKWDNKTNEYDVLKILDREDDKDVRWFNNQYKKYKKDWQMPAEDAAPGRSSRAPNIIIDNRPMYGGGGSWGKPKPRSCYDPL